MIISSGILLEAVARVEPARRGFADRCVKPLHHTAKNAKAFLLRNASIVPNIHHHRKPKSETFASDSGKAEL